MEGKKRKERIKERRNLPVIIEEVTCRKVKALLKHCS